MAPGAAATAADLPDRQAGDDLADGEPSVGNRSQRRGRTVRELAALGWIVAAVAASYLLGFAIGVTVVIAAYCLAAVRWRRRWQSLLFAAGAAGTAFVIAVAFISLFHLTFFGVLL